MPLFGKTPSSQSSLAVVALAKRLDIIGVERQQGKRPRIQRCESYPLDAGLASTLTRLRQGGKLAATCATLLRDGEYHFLSLEAPTLPESAPQTELREAVRWKVKDMVDFPVTAAGVDTLRIPPQPGRPAQLLAAAARHATLRPLIESFHAAKLELTQISVPELAQRNIAHLFETPDRALALLTFGASNGLLTLTCNGALYATRRIDVSAPDLARDKSLYERVVLDVQRSLDNFDRNFSQLSLQRLLVLPVPGADDFVANLRDNLYQPVETLTISDGLDIDAAPMLGNIATLSDALPAIGLALGIGLGQALDAGTQGAINLFDPALLPQHDPWTARNLGFGLATVGMVCVAWGGWAHWRAADAAVALKAVSPQLQAAHAETQQLTKQVGEHKPDAVLLGKLDDNQSRLQARTEVLALLRKGMSPESGNPAEWLRGFARQVPAGLWLTGFTVNADTSALEIHGRTLDPSLIAEYVKRLNAEKSFQGRTFTALSISGPPAATSATAANTAPVQTAGAPPVGTPAQPAPHAGQAKKVAAAATVQYHEFALTSSPTDSSPPAGGHS